MPCASACGSRKVCGSNNNAEHQDHDVFDQTSQPVALAAQAMQRGLSLAEGPLLRAALVHPPCGPDVLLIVAHHFAIDGVSWRILIQDLAAILEARARGAAPVLPAKTASLQQWAAALADFAASEKLQEQVGYWLEEPETEPLHAPGENTVASSQSESAALSAEETEQLLNAASTQWRASIEELVLTAVGQALARWTGCKTIRVEMEGHGREDAVARLDLSRTIGWFTSLYPLTLEVDPARPAGDAVADVRARVRAVPDRGIGYGCLRYFAGDTLRAALAAHPPPEVRFNYFGVLDAVLPESAPFRLAAADLPSHNPGEQRSCLLEISSRLAQGRLALSVTYSRNLHTQTVIEAFLADCVAALQTLAGTGQIAVDEFGWSLQDVNEIAAVLGAEGGA